MGYSHPHSLWTVGDECLRYLDGLVFYIYTCLLVLFFIQLDCVILLGSGQ